MIEVDAVSKNFGGMQAVRDCTLTIPHGSITGLIGPNGAGKSTLFNMIAGLHRPTRGHIRMAGRDVTDLPPPQRFALGLVRTFQIPQMFSRLTVLDNLMIVPLAQTGNSLLASCLRWSVVRAEERRNRARAEAVLDTLKLGHMRDELAGNLSGGQKKLLELGRAMMTDAKVILLDEIAAGVNPTLLQDIARHIRRLNHEQGCTFCIIEHDMDLIALLCDPVIVMAQGTVLMQGTMAEVRANPQVVEAYLGQPEEPAAAQGGAAA